MNQNDFEKYIDSIVDVKTGQMHIAMPATIMEFDATTCLAVVQPELKYHITDGNVMDYPMISNVPVFMPHAGNTQITYPVKVNDPCLLVFCERSTDEWMGYSGENQHDSRRFNLTDAFAFVGMRPTQSINPENVELINEKTKVSVTPNNVVNIIGDVVVKGNIIASGDVIGGGISLIGHTHPYHHGSTGSSQ